MKTKLVLLYLLILIVMTFVIAAVGSYHLQRPSRPPLAHSNLPIANTSSAYQPYSPASNRTPLYSGIPNFSVISFSAIYRPPPIIFSFPDITITPKHHQLNLLPLTPYTVFYSDDTRYAQTILSNNARFDFISIAFPDTQLAWPSPPLNSTDFKSSSLAPANPNSLSPAIAAANASSTPEPDSFLLFAFSAASILALRKR